MSFTTKSHLGARSAAVWLRLGLCWPTERAPCFFSVLRWHDHIAELQEMISVSFSRTEDHIFCGEPLWSGQCYRGEKCHRHPP